MKRVKAILKYTAISITVGLLALGLGAADFLIKNKAPLISRPVVHGVKYKDDLKLDIYLPTGPVFHSSPVVFFIHGGAWIGGTKAAINYNRFNGAVNTLRAAGYTIIAPDYSVAGKTENVFPDCILDLYDAIEWTKNNASLYGLDTTNMGLLGESAGAHIAMMIAFSDSTLKPEKYETTDFNYLIDVYGPNDLMELYYGNTVEKVDHSIKRVSRILGSEFDIKEYVFGFDPLQDSIRAKEMLHDFSPINIVGQNEIPVLIIHGRNDRIVPVQQSIMLKQKLDSLCVPNEMHLIHHMDHNFIFSSQQQRDSTQVWVSDFVMRCYKNPS